MKLLNFTQTISIRTDNPEKLIAHLEHWDRNQATADIMGYMGTHLLADRENPGCFLIVANFAVVDPKISASEEATRNNDRSETQAWADGLLALIEGEPEYHHYDELYRTD